MVTMTEGAEISKKTKICKGEQVGDLSRPEVFVFPNMFVERKSTWYIFPCFGRSEKWLAEWRFFANEGKENKRDR